MNRAIALSIAVLAAGCQTAQETAGKAPDHRAIILANKGRLWKDPDSIKGAQISEPRLSMGIWQVCVRLNARNGYGGYAGESDELIQISEDGSPPWNMGGPAPYCSNFSYSAFPELNGPAGRQSGSKR